jgi:hypothetical protein
MRNSLRSAAHLRSQAVIAAFANVPRKHFVRSGPWRIKNPMNVAEYWTTEDANPRAVYHDLLIALDVAHGINNGQPSLWASLFDQLGIAVGEQRKICDRNIRGWAQPANRYASTRQWIRDWWTGGFERGRHTWNWYANPRETEHSNIEKAAQFARVVRVLKFAQRLGLDLPDSFAGY